MLAALPEEVLFALARSGCARLALLCRRIAAFFARPEIRREAIPPYYSSLSNRGKYLFLSRALSSAGDCYEILLPHLRLAAEPEGREARRVAAALMNAPAAPGAGPAFVERIASFARANPRAALALSFRDDARMALIASAAGGEHMCEAAGNLKQDFMKHAGGPGFLEAMTRGLPLYFWGSPAKVREMRATGAPLSFAVPGPVCRCDYQPFGPLLGIIGPQCSCRGISSLVKAYDSMITSGDAAVLLAALREAARPLAPEHGGDGSEPTLDPSDLDARRLMGRVLIGLPDLTPAHLNTIVKHCPG